mgnify:FL=1
MAIIPSSRGVVFYDPTHRLYRTANQSNANLTDQAYTMQDIIDTVNASTEQHLIPTDLIKYSSVGEQYAPYTAVNTWKYISMVTPPSTYGGAPYTSQPTQQGVDYMAPMFKIESITSQQIEVDPYDFGANGASVFGQTQDSQWSFSGSSATFGLFATALNNWYNAGNNTFTFTLNDGVQDYTYTDVPFQTAANGNVMIFTDGVNPANADFPSGTYISTFGFGVQLTSLIAGGIDINSDVEISEETEKAWMWKGGDGTWRWRVQAPVAIESGNPNIIYTSSVFNANN